MASDEGLPDIELDPRLCERFAATAALQEDLTSFTQALEEHPQLAARFEELLDSINAWLAALTRSA